MEPAERREQCIKDLESVLSQIGLHSGAVTLTKDKKSSGTTQDNPNKICMGGSKARHLLANHSRSESHTQFQIWKQVCDVTTFRGNDAHMGLKRAQIWETLDDLVKLMEKPKLTDDEIETLQDAIQNFTSQMVDAWGETHITHYMVKSSHFNQCYLSFL